MKVALIYPNLRGEISPSLSLTYVATTIAQYHKVTLMDFSLQRKWWKKYLQTQMHLFKPDVVGITSFTFNFFDGLQIARLIKRDYPDIPIIFGGIHPTLMPEQTLKFKEIDAICIGEGELTFPEYVDKIEKGLSLKGVKGIWYKENGNLIKNEIRPLIENLDTIPFPDWRFWRMDLYLKIPSYIGTMHLLASRGCPFNCTYCSNHALRKILPGKYVRFRSPENIIEEIKLMKEQYGPKGFKFLYFWDEIFIMNKKHFNQFCDLYIKEGLNKEIIWTANMRADLINNDWAKKAKKAGCNQVRLGIEAGSDYIRNVIYNKNITTAQIRKATAILKKHDIMMRFNIMLGGPCETTETMKSSVQLINELQPEIFFFSIFQPLPKTEILETIQKINGRVYDEQWEENPNFWFKSIVDQPNLSSKAIERFTQRTLMKYVWKFFWLGLKMRKVSFLRDILNFFVNYKIKYQILTIYATTVTIRKYQNEDWKIRNNIPL